MCMGAWVGLGGEIKLNLYNFPLDDDFQPNNRCLWVGGGVGG